MVGFQILQRRRQVDARYVQAFAEIPVANVSDCMTRMTAGGPRLRPMHKGGRLGGPALTVKCRPGDNLMIHKALDMAQPGDLILGDADGLLCVPFDDVERVLAASREKVALEQKTIENIRAGKHDTSWVDARLKAQGCDPVPR